ncbi:MAG TPA: hypothetical protein ENG14_02395 [Thermodesulforhabdus norvegica]|uniref:Uncharacterized protein n=1 Tax=Thermodesulforhabdus norvegica TaxID=39841 RepID=A0A7C1AXU0_9BACT|nr:hypothetical protein [Thermodesulforhabdus norvegica]
MSSEYDIQDILGNMPCDTYDAVDKLIKTIGEYDEEISQKNGEIDRLANNFETVKARNGELIARTEGLEKDRSVQAKVVRETLDENERLRKLIRSKDVSIKELVDMAKKRDGSQREIDIVKAESDSWEQKFKKAEKYNQTLLESEKGLLEQVRSLIETVDELRFDKKELKGLEKEKKRADAWVKAVRDLAREIGIEDDDSDGSIKDWRDITHMVRQAIEKFGKVDLGEEKKTYQGVEVHDDLIASLQWQAAAVPYVYTRDNKEFSDALRTMKGM